MPRTIILSDCGFAVQQADDGGCVLVIKEPDTGDLYQIEFRREAKGRLVGRLTGIDIASSAALDAALERQR